MPGIFIFGRIQTIFMVVLQMGPNGNGRSQKSLASHAARSWPPVLLLCFLLDWMPLSSTNGTIRLALDSYMVTWYGMERFMASWLQWNGIKIVAGYNPSECYQYHDGVEYRRFRFEPSTARLVCSKDLIGDRFVTEYAWNEATLRDDEQERNYLQPMLVTDLFEPTDDLFVIVLN